MCAENEPPERHAVVNVLARSALFALAAAGLTYAAGRMADEDPAWTLSRTVSLASAALHMSLVSVFELAAERRAPGWRRDLTAALVTVLGAALAGGLSCFESFYLYGMLAHRSVPDALTGLERFAKTLGEAPRGVFGTFFLLSLLLGPLVLGRLRKWRLESQVAAALTSSLALLLPGFLVYRAVRELGFVEYQPPFFVKAVVAPRSSPRPARRRDRERLRPPARRELTGAERGCRLPRDMRA
jgi:hypothetical protein